MIEYANNPVLIRLAKSYNVQLQLPSYYGPEVLHVFIIFHLCNGECAEVVGHPDHGRP